MNGREKYVFLSLKKYLCKEKKEIYPIHYPGFMFLTENESREMDLLGFFIYDKRLDYLCDILHTNMDTTKISFLVAEGYEFLSDDNFLETLNFRVDPFFLLNPVDTNLEIAASRSKKIQKLFTRNGNKDFCIYGYKNKKIINRKKII
jgi:hypothetical protein